MVDKKKQFNVLLIDALSLPPSPKKMAAQYVATFLFPAGAGNDDDDVDDGYEQDDEDDHKNKNKKQGTATALIAKMAKVTLFSFRTTADFAKTACDTTFELIDATTEALARWWGRVEESKKTYTHTNNAFVNRYSGHAWRVATSQRLLQKNPGHVPVVIVYHPDFWTAALQPVALTPAAANQANGNLPSRGYVMICFKKDATLTELMIFIRTKYRVALRPEYGVVLNLNHTLPPLSARIGTLYTESQHMQNRFASYWNRLLPPDVDARQAKKLEGADGFLYIQIKPEQTFG